MVVVILGKYDGLSLSYDKKHMIADFSKLRKLPPKDNQRGCFGKKETSPINKQLELFTDGKSLFTQFQPLDNHIG